MDPSGCGFIDCVKALAELADALKNLAQREAENAAAGNCDPGHDKAIQQAKNRVANAVAKTVKCIPADETQRILNSLKQLGEDLGNKIWNWLNNDPRQNELAQHIWSPRWIARASATAGTSARAYVVP